MRVPISKQLARRGSISMALAAALLALSAVDASRPFLQLSQLGSRALALVRSNPSERFMACGGFRVDPGFGRALLIADRSLPRDAQLTLELAPQLRLDAVNFYRFRAAFALAPRPVRVIEAELGRRRYRLVPQSEAPVQGSEEARP